MTVKEPQRENYHDENFMTNLIEKIRSKEVKRRKSMIVDPYNEEPRESDFHFDQSQIDEFSSPEKDTNESPHKKVQRYKRPPRVCVD